MEEKEHAILARQGSKLRHLKNGWGPSGLVAGDPEIDPVVGQVQLVRFCAAVIPARPEEKALAGANLKALILLIDPKGPMPHIDKFKYIESALGVRFYEVGRKYSRFQAFYGEIRA